MSFITAGKIAIFVILMYPFCKSTNNVQVFWRIIFIYFKVFIIISAHVNTVLFRAIRFKAP